MHPGGQPSLQRMLQQAQKLQQQMADARDELVEAKLTGASDGGLVTVTMTGTGQVTEVKIDPKAVDPDDVETLEGLVLAAIQDGARAVRDLVQERMGGFTAGLGGPGGGQH